MTGTLLQWPPVVVVMGVAGAGKSTVARMVADQLGWDFEEGDDLHSRASVAKMASGQPLDDEDRWPWLAEIATWIAGRVTNSQPAIITCSALKKRYRDVLRGEHVVFVHLAGTREEIGRRLAARVGHYLPACLLDSQFADLEPPTEDENSITIDIGAVSSAQAAEEIISRLGLVLLERDRTREQTERRT